MKPGLIKAMQPFPTPEALLPVAILRTCPARRVHKTSKLTNQLKTRVYWCFNSSKTEIEVKTLLCRRFNLSKTGIKARIRPSNSTLD
jgi:hypothetical protein